jgi:hypothetical protein
VADDLASQSAGADIVIADKAARAFDVRRPVIWATRA